MDNDCSIMDGDLLTSLKILLLGESNVGKSSVLYRFIADEFLTQTTTTIGLDCQNKVIKIDGNAIKLCIWDTAGHERFRSITPNFYREAQGVVLVYDVTDRTTLIRLSSWLNELNVYCHQTEVVKMVVGNKIDAPNREVSTEEGLQFAQRHHALYIESSAKTADGVNCCFEELAQKIIETPDLWVRYSLTSYDNGSAVGSRYRDQRFRLRNDTSPEKNPSWCSCAWWAPAL